MSDIQTTFLALGLPINKNDLDEMRLQAHQAAFRGDYEQGKALERLVNALEEDGKEEALAAIQGAIDSIEETTNEVKTALETFDSDFKSNIETLFDNLLSDFPISHDTKALKEIENSILVVRDILLKDFGELGISTRGIGTVEDAVKSALSDINSRKEDIEDALTKLGCE